MTTRARKSSAPKEADVLAAVLEAFTLFGVTPERRNTGGMVNASGQYVRFGQPGDPDVTAVLPAQFGAAAGKAIAVECKRPGFRPERLSGKARAHFRRQLARLAEVNEAGGFGFWCDDAAQVARVLERIKDGFKIIFIDDYPYLDDGEEGRT